MHDDVQRQSFDPDADSPSSEGPASEEEGRDRGDATVQRATEETPPPWGQRAGRLEIDGLMHLERGEYARAGDLLAKALGLYEEHGDEEATLSVAQYLGVALYEIGKEKEAVAVWEEMMGRGWSGPTIFGLLLRHYEKQGQPEKIERLHARLRDSVVARDAEDFAPTPPGAEEGLSRDTPRILVADNDDDVRDVLVRLLRMEGYDVEEVGDGEAALKRIVRDPPDIVVLDVYMPRRSGVDVLYQLRARGLTTPVLVISGMADDAMVRDAVVLGARFLGKPVDVDELRSTLEIMLSEASSDDPEPGKAPGADGDGA